MAAEENDYVPPRLPMRGFAREFIYAIGIAMGLGTLWLMETVRNRFFRLLDWTHLRPRMHRGSAFPPGQPRRLAVKKAGH
jgi:hypothetical protein